MALPMQKMRVMGVTVQSIRGMISFSKGYLGLSTIFNTHGSPWPRVVLPAAVASLECLVMFYIEWEDAEGARWTLSQWWAVAVTEWKAYSVFATVTMFLLVFRTNLAYSRYWEGITKMQGVSSNWTSACTHCLAFSKNTARGSQSFDLTARQAAEAAEAVEAEAAGTGRLPDSLAADPEEVDKNACFCHDVMHLTSLLHAVAIQDLRLDAVLDNLIPFHHDQVRLGSMNSCRGASLASPHGSMGNPAEEAVPLPGHPSFETGTAADEVRYASLTNVQIELT